MTMEMTEAFEIMRAEHYGHAIGTDYLRGDVSAREIGEIWSETAFATENLPAVWQAFVNGYNRAVREG